MANVTFDCLTKKCVGRRVESITEQNTVEFSAQTPETAGPSTHPIILTHTHKSLHTHIMYDLLVFVNIPKNCQEYIFEKREKLVRKKYTKITKDAKNKTYLKK